MRHFPWFTRLGVVLAALAGLGLAGCQKQSAMPQAGGPAQVSVVTIETERVVLTTELPGRTSAYLVAEIRPRVSGLLLERKFREGAFVQAGELLYQIDPVPYQTAYDQAMAAQSTAEANLVLAEATLPATRSRAERLKELAAIKAVGQQDSDDANAALRQAMANIEVCRKAVDSARVAVEAARIQLSYTPIQAPISGRIGISNITVGGLVTAYQPVPLAVIQQLDPIYVDVTQASNELLRLRRNLENGLLKHGASQNKVKLILEDGSIYAREGALQFRDVTVDPTTGSFTLRLVFPNPRQELLPGMFVRAVVEEGINETALLVPQQGVSRDPKGNPVAWLVDATGKVEQRVLELDRPLGDKWLVKKGLAPGDRVIMEGTQKPRPGAPVQAVPYAGPASAGARPPAVAPEQ